MSNGNDRCGIVEGEQFDCSKLGKVGTAAEQVGATRSAELPEGGRARVRDCFVARGRAPCQNDTARRNQGKSRKGRRVRLLATAAVAADGRERLLAYLEADGLTEIPTRQRPSHDPDLTATNAAQRLVGRRGTTSAEVPTERARHLHRMAPRNGPSDLRFRTSRGEVGLSPDAAPRSHGRYTAASRRDVGVRLLDRPRTGRARPRPRCGPTAPRRSRLPTVGSRAILHCRAASEA